MAKLWLAMISVCLATVRTMHAVAESQEDCVDSTCAKVDVNFLQQEFQMAGGIARHKQLSADVGNKTPAKPQAACYISECGCPGTFKKSWCKKSHTSGARGGWCWESKSNCEGSCNGVYCEIQADAEASWIRSEMPIVVVSRRKSFTEEEPLKKYWEIFEETAAYFLEAIDMQAVIQVLETDPNFYQDIQIFNGKDAFMDHVNMSNKRTAELLSQWGPQMMMAGPMQKPPTFFEGVVYGGWDDETIKETDAFMAKFKPVEALYGYITKDWACKASLPVTTSSPVIVNSRRKVKAGKMASLATDVGAIAAWYEANLPGVGVLAITAGPDSEDPDLVNDLQIFGDFQAFVDHMCGDFPWPTASFCNRHEKDCDSDKSRTCGAMLEQWMTNYNMSFPFQGEIFASKDKLPLILKATSGMGAQFVGYAFEDAHGSGPNFANAGGCAACNSLAGGCGGY